VTFCETGTDETLFPLVILSGAPDEKPNREINRARSRRIYVFGVQKEIVAPAEESDLVGFVIAMANKSQKCIDPSTSRPSISQAKQCSGASLRMTRG
jgi:hypothetical protein